MTQTQKWAYRLLVQTVVLLVLYLLAALLVAAKFISAHDPLALSLPYNQLAPLAIALLNLAALTGLIGGGVYAAAMYRADCRLSSERLLRLGTLLWSVLLVLAVVAGLLGLLEGRHLLALPPLLVALQLFASALIGLAVFSAAPRPPVVQVWLVGWTLSLVSGLFGVLTPGDFLQTRALQTLSAGITLYVAYPLMLVALGFWLMRRFSHITPDWADTGIYSVAGMVTLAGTLVALSPLLALGAPAWMQTLGNLSAILIPILYLIFAAHAYRALSDRNPIRTLAAHWFALALLLVLLGPGLLGALQAVPSVSQWTLGTRLGDLQTTLTLFAPLAMALGVANQAAAELRGQNHRVTGFIPFWLVSFGIVFVALSLGAAGVAQTYMERRLSIGYLDVQTLLEPLYALWFGGLVLAALGAAVYALTFWRRRPTSQV